MQKERRNKQNKPGKETKEGYIIVPNYFLKKWVRVLGAGPVVLYQELLTYCHKEKTIAWPTIDFLGSKMKPDRYQNDTYVGSNLKLSLVSNRYPNNNNLNSTNTTTTKEGKDAVAAVDFKKIKEKGDLSACLPERGRLQSGNAQAEEKTQVIREQLRDLDFEGKFIEQLLKDFNPKKIEEKLDLLMERRNIQNPAGWLMAALKNDYQDPEQEAQITPHPHLDPPPPT